MISKKYIKEIISNKLIKDILNITSNIKVLNTLNEKGIVLKNENGSYRIVNDNIFRKSYGFENIAIVQKKNICKSRLDVDIKSQFVRDVDINIPLIASNMSTVIDKDFYIKLNNLGAGAIYHRAGKNEDIIKDIKEISKECEIVAVSIGLGLDQVKFAWSLISVGANVICIDVAHGYSDEVINLAKKIKQYDPFIKIILGNTVNPQFLLECDDVADAVKVGIGQGYACDTKNTAGCTERQFSAVFKFKELATELGMPIISDGGIREPADFTKAIAAGASTVMSGKLFAACPESAAEVCSVDDKQVKLYAGMASEYVQNSWKGGLKEGTCAEGGIRYLEISESVEKILERYCGALKSGITYAGAKDIDSFHKNAEFILI
jgi:IMP dehydrogenase/GMP reductase